MKKNYFENTVNELNACKNYVNINLNAMGISIENADENVVDAMMSDFFNLSEYEKVLYHFKDSDSGKYGKAFEMNCKNLVNGNRGNAGKVSAKGKTDMQNNHIKYEIKSNCGEIADNITKNVYVIYTANNRDDYATPQNAYVIPSEDFVDIIENLGLMRTKKTTNGYTVKAIQTYSNSKRKKTALVKAISQYPTVGEWFEF